MTEDTRKTPEEIMAMSDDEVRRMALTGNENSRTFVFGVAEMKMRSTLRFAAAVEATATANQDLVTTTKQVVDAHHGLIRQTRYLVIATWGLVVITLLSQAGVIVFELVKPK